MRTSSSQLTRMHIHGCGTRSSQGLQATSQSGVQHLALFKLNGAMVSSSNISSGGLSWSWPSTIEKYLRLVMKAASSVKLGVGYMKEATAMHIPQVCSFHGQFDCTIFIFVLLVYSWTKSILVRTMKASTAVNRLYKWCHTTYYWTRSCLNLWVLLENWELEEGWG